MVLLKLFAGLNPVRFIRRSSRRSWCFAFSTATSNATIPLNIETLEEKYRASTRRISSFTIPLGATINMDGTSIMQGVAVVFTAQAVRHRSWRPGGLRRPSSPRPRSLRSARRASRRWA